MVNTIEAVEITENFIKMLGPATVPLPDEAFEGKGGEQSDVSSEIKINGKINLPEAFERRLARRFTLTQRRRVFGVIDEFEDIPVSGWITIEGRVVPKKDRHIRGERLGRWYRSEGWQSTPPRSVLLAASLKNLPWKLNGGLHEAGNEPILENKMTAEPEMIDSVSADWERPTLGLLSWSAFSFNPAELREFVEAGLAAQRA